MAATRRLLRAFFAPAAIDAAFHCRTHLCAHPLSRLLQLPRAEGGWAVALRARVPGGRTERPSIRERLFDSQCFACARAALKS